jgi:hypothetical protein
MAELVTIKFEDTDVQVVKGTADAPEIVRFSETGKAEKAYGKDLPEPLTYEYTYDAYVDFKFVPPSELPKEKEQLKWRNDKAKMASRTKAQEEKLKDAGFEKPTLKTSEDLRVRQIVNALVAGGWTEEDATAHAKSMQKPTA